jgi:hypothetical protein
MARDKQGVTKIAKALKRTIGATSVMAAKKKGAVEHAGIAANRMDALFDARHLERFPAVL